MTLVNTFLDCKRISKAGIFFYAFLSLPKVCCWILEEINLVYHINLGRILTFLACSDQNDLDGIIKYWFSWPVILQNTSVIFTLDLHGVNQRLPWMSPNYGTKTLSFFQYSQCKHECITWTINVLYWV